MSKLIAALRHLGPLGLFLLAIVDSSPVPAFNALDILLAILAGRHRDPWYELAAVTTAGSIIGAFITFQIARRAGSAYLHSKFGEGRVAAFLKLFQRSGTGTLVGATAIPVPLPTTVIFAVAGASNYNLRKFLTVVAVSRAARYTLISVVADLYGRRFVRLLRHPAQSWGWLVLFAALVVLFAISGILLNRRFSRPSAA